MSEPIVTRQFEIDTHAYLAAVWTRSFLKFVAWLLAFYFVVGVAGVLIVGPTFGTGMIIAIACLLPIFVVARWFGARRAVYNPKNALGLAARTMEFNDVGVRVKTVTGVESYVPWSNFLPAERRGCFTFLYLGTATAYVITDDAFDTAGRRSAFFDLVAKSTKWKGRPPSGP